ncbi:hypothetical protein [Ulvibacter antarcticus]|uniref:Uncharacterized protein n=1 Tax=Ulvibacter antarcticus TaxID=442714 RepID=A0A3L9YZF3_9FLAO|nr:hypothetical protein [Ulvibacter antarcticus]RMA66091.1 hypothetical protein BXY75_0510 [Ulvibacter antarcticus]
MKNEDKKIYLLKVECSAVEINKHRKKKTVRKIEKKYVFRSLDSLNDKIENLNGSIPVYEETLTRNWITQFTSYLKKYGDSCKESYQAMLRT